MFAHNIGITPMTTSIEPEPTSDLGLRPPNESDRWAWLLSPRRSLHRSDVWLLAMIAIAAFLVRIIPVLIGGGLLGLQGYDDGVYFGAASSLIHGVIPYRDFLLLHPPGIVIALTPFAMLGAIIGDPAAFAVARVSFIALGAMNAVLVALVAGRYRRLAGLMAGGLYAVWNTSANAERTADLLAPENALLLLGLLALAGRGRITPHWASLGGIALGLAMTVHLWQAISAAILLWWVVVRARSDGWGRVRPALAFLVAAGIVFGLVCAPFVLAAPEAMVRYVLVDQVGRPSVGIGLTDRLLELAGLTRLANVPAFLRPLVSNVALIASGVGGLAVVVRDGVAPCLDATMGRDGDHPDSRGALDAVVLSRLSGVRRARYHTRVRDWFGGHHRRPCRATHAADTGWGRDHGRPDHTGRFLADLPRG